MITDGVTPSLHVDYKHTTIKQYHKEGKALRTETTINNTRDFGIGKRLTNLPALREIGFSANRRLLGVQRLSHDPITGTDALAAITGTVTTATGARIPGLRFADRRTHALLSALLIFRLHPHGFTNKDLRTYTAELRGLDPGAVTAGQITYDLRRLKTRNLITRIDGHPPLPGHRPRPGHREVPHLRPGPRIALRPRRTRHRHTHPRPSAIRRHRIPHRGRKPHHGSIIRATKHQPPQPQSNTSEPDPHTTDLTQKSGFAGSSHLGLCRRQRQRSHHDNGQHRPHAHMACELGDSSSAAMIHRPAGNGLRARRRRTMATGAKARWASSAAVDPYP